MQSVKADSFVDQKSRNEECKLSIEEVKPASVTAKTKNQGKIKNSLQYININKDIANCSYSAAANIIPRTKAYRPIVFEDFETTWD